ncbi:MAG: type IV secretion system DNA-binding domain-containing protein [Gemmatimonadales bacterium]
MHPTDIARIFDEWEQRTRGSTVWPYRVPIEPAFSPLFPTERTPKPIIDDARRPGLFDRVRMATARTTSTAMVKSVETPVVVPQREIVEFELLLPADFAVKLGMARSWLASFRSLVEPVSFELVGLPDRVVVVVACGVVDAASVIGSLHSYFPEAKARERKDLLRQQWERDAGYGFILGFGLKDRVFSALRAQDSFEVDPLIGIIGDLSRFSAGELGVIQFLVAPARAPWGEEFENFALSIDDVDKVLPLIRSKFSEPLFATVLRVAAVAPEKDRAIEVARDLAYAVSGAMRSEVNDVVLADWGDHSFEAELEDMLDRAAHRSGMLLSLSEVLTVFHPPSASVRSERLVRQGQRTKAAPAAAIGHSLVLGTNEHDEELRTVSLSTEDRLRHTYIIGASGTGKSTLLLSMAQQDLIAGNGIAVLDPHGDLIEDILARMPEERVNDVVVFDPADEAYPVGFNILSAHSELERTLLASDLVSVFKRLSTSFGDQMVAVLGNAILAFLENPEGGTLVDLRRFLIDKSFRARFLEGVEDEQVVSYWQEEFSLLKGLPHAPILTRLNIFLRSKLIRHMVAQKKDRLDMRAIMDGKKILLAKLSHGGIGEENAHLLGSLIVAKIAQAAMSRQDEAAAKRVPFFLYIDEFHHFVTPSLAGILSGARKYGLGLTLAHQEMRQLKSRSEEVASAVLGNAFTRIVFRVGDQDAKTLADGFSFFEAKDLQNLGIGEAIARIERPDFDFNLRTSPLPTVSAEVGASHRKAVIDASRASYATPREQIEAELRVRSAAEEGEEEETSRAPRKPARRKAEPPATPTAGQPEERLPGRGGPQHKYLQSLVRKLAEDRGFNVAVEKRVLDGHGHIDVFLERDGLTIGCEISVTTAAEHEIQNLFKCLAAGFKYVVLLSPDEETLVDARSRLGHEHDERVRFLTPDGFIDFLKEFEPAKPSTDAGHPAGAVRVGQGLGSGPPEGTRMLIAEDAAAYLGLGRQALAKMRLTGDSPPFFKVGRRVLYDRDELDAWLSTRKRRSTSDPGS